MEWNTNLPPHEHWVNVTVEYTYICNITGCENLSFSKRFTSQARYDIGKNCWITPYPILGLSDHIPIDGLTKEDGRCVRTLSILGWLDVPAPMTE